MIGRSLRAFPTLLRVAVADMVAYRAEFLIWVLTTNMPLVMLAVWHRASEDAPVGRFGQKEFAAYFLSTVIVRLMVQCWVAWELTMDIRQGTLAMKLMRPIHPVLAYSAEQLAAIPMRILYLTPVVAVLVYAAGEKIAITDPAMAAIFVLSILGAWLMTFVIGVMMGTLSMFLQSAFSVFDLWMALHSVFSGYLVPLELFPPWMRTLADVLPFKYMLSFPVQTLIGMETQEQALRDLGVQWMYVVVLTLAARALWQRGMKKFVAFGG